MVRYCIIGILCIFTLNGMSQNDSEGRINIIQDNRIDTLLARHIEINEHFLKNADHKDIDGYRIQIFFESGNRSSTSAREIIEKFEEKYPDNRAYLTWKAPNFRVRVGDFRTRIEAEGFLQRIIYDYPNAWVIKDKINFPSLN